VGKMYQVDIFTHSAEILNYFCLRCW